MHLVELRGTGQIYAMKAMDKTIMLDRNKVHTLLSKFFTLLRLSLFELQRSYLRVQEFIVFVVFKSYKQSMTSVHRQLLHVLYVTSVCLLKLLVSGYLQVYTLVCPQVHRACAERQILEILDHPFLPTLFASFQVCTHACPAT